jgi:V/A-type H+/Na+-transporting ATPase subunit K
MNTERDRTSLTTLAIMASLISSGMFFVFGLPAQTHTAPAFAQEETAGSDSAASKLIGAGMAFGLAALGAGIGLGFVGAAGLAAISDNPKMQSRVFIIVGMVESIAIYGIVMMFIILGQ